MSSDHAPITVCMAEGRPCALHLKGRRVPVQVIADYWVLEGRWWQGRTRRVYLRLATPAGTLEVYRTADTWHLSRVLD